MSLLSYLELCELVEQGIINANIENVNSSSIDITLDSIIRLEERGFNIVDISRKENIKTIEQEIDSGEGFLLHPKQFLLASSVETFNLPNNISAEYKLKSTMARNGLEHLNAGWCDAGWCGSKLTLELYNVTRYNSLILRSGMKIGQVVFFRHNEVPEDKSYKARGQYNNQTKVTAANELK